jgi:exopolyphosphatase/guanosine-5'-triphosphate,3'-diphosphate pyrophosphatase
LPDPSALRRPGGNDVSVVSPGRWEWRTFGGAFGGAEDAFGGEPERVQESDETYVLSVQEGDTVKVRDALMDVKHLEHANEDGLEQWLPVMKAEFPLPAADVASVLASLGVEAPALERDAYTLEQLLDEVVRPCNELLPVDVHKLRRRFTIGDCMAELSDVGAGGHSTRTIAIETEDPDLVIAAVRELGLAERRNTSFPRGLKALLHFGRFAVVDVGTNSVKFHIGEHRADGSWKTIVDRSEITRLGEGLDRSGKLEPEPMARTIDAIAGMAEEAKRADVVDIAAVGTAGMRIASNAAELVDGVQARCGVTIEVIPGREEARLAYRAAVAGLGIEGGSLAVFDTGGGSSQFTFGDGKSVDEQFSVDVGAVRFTERFGLDEVVSDGALAEALAAIASDLTELDGRPPSDAVVAMGGAITNLAAVKHELAAYDPEIVQGTVLDRGEIDRQIELYRTRTADRRREIVGLQPKRAEVILAGACIARTVLDKLGRESLTVSDRGLRHGLLVERFG